ncbi:MAG: tRNA epoxyqueuosine(34) reductase QueG, partial [Planctomycetes bacterium]|nr:tRNA epoxyqueuosine(34) reductase QueG [Planctomycetota bacterium]
MNATTLTDRIKQSAYALGFDRAGVCAAVVPPGAARFDRWLEEGYAGAMHYLPSRREAYQHPNHVLDGVRSIVVLTMNYRTLDPAAPQAGQGRVSRYAWGNDYHDVIHERLKQLVAEVDELAPGSHSRGAVDTAPLLERDLAQLAGLGWIGKNTLLLNREDGSWFFLAALLTSAELEFDRPHETDHCGTCTACLDACPTDAFPQPYVLDATRCISYLTIELRQAIPQDLREGIGDWLFGCDVCQDVCPWNHRAPMSEASVFHPADDANPMDLIELFSLDDAAFRQRFRHTPLWRTKRRGLLRNAAIVLGNAPTDAA